MWTGLVRHSISTHKHTAWQLLHSAAEALKGQGACSSAPSPCPAPVMPGMAYMANIAPTAMTAEQDQTATGPPRKRVKHDAVKGTGAPSLTGPAAQSKLQELQATNRTPISASHLANGTAVATQLASKSAKRKAAEALLASRFTNNSSPGVSDSGNSTGSLHQHTSAAGASAGVSGSISSSTAAYASAVRMQHVAAQPSSSSTREGLVVDACDSSCAHHKAHGWCHQEAHLPDVDWITLLARPSPLKSVARAPGYEQHSLGHGLEVLVIEDPLYVAPALAKLRASMTDPYVCLDMEWKPEFGKGQRPTPVALIQLSSATTAVLIRTCLMQNKLPQALRSFFADPAITLVGFSWYGSDEAKMQQTFGGGAATMFARTFLDLRSIAEGLGYHGHGLQRLAKAVLGVELSKAKSISMSNWEQRTLTSKQVRYAALDVLVCGQVLRGLRLWHSVAPTPCSACLQPLGQVPSMPLTRFVCAEEGCGKAMLDVQSYLNHCRQTKHAPLWQECASCGRVCRAQVAVEGSAAAGHASDGELQLAAV